MDTGFYNAAIRMASGSVIDMEVCAENLANASMPGYKRQNVMHSPFADIMSDNVSESTNSESSSVKTDHTQGALNRTGETLDFAIDGKGFFTFSSVKGDQTFYSRNGHCHMNADRVVVNSIGMPLQTTSGDLRIPPEISLSEIHVDESRNVRVLGRVIGQLKIMDVENPDQMQKAGNSIFVAADGVEPVEAESETIVSNQFLEQSNTEIFEELVSMMSTLRNYEACQKMMQSADTTGKQMMAKLVG